MANRVAEKENMDEPKNEDCCSDDLLPLNLAVDLLCFHSGLAPLHQPLLSSSKASLSRFFVHCSVSWKLFHTNGNMSRPIIDCHLTSLRFRAVVTEERQGQQNQVQKFHLVKAVSLTVSFLYFLYFLFFFHFTTLLCVSLLSFVYWCCHHVLTAAPEEQDLMKFRNYRKLTERKLLVWIINNVNLQ